MAHATPLVVCVVSHTHWDREWYHPLPRFRQRLVALIDALLAEDAGGPFLLDGQAITLLDYLTVRPAQFERLAAALRDGCLEAGPWFVLADNLIPGGEAIVRNLEAGRRVLARFGARAPQVAYCPDTFGHPAALPPIAAGFGLPVAVVWRGAGGASLPPTDAFEWAGPDGASVFVHHLPPDGYEFGSALPVEAMAVAERWRRLQALFAQRNRTGVVLLLNGAIIMRGNRSRAGVAALQRAAQASEGWVLWRPPRWRPPHCKPGPIGSGRLRPAVHWPGLCHGSPVNCAIRTATPGRWVARATRAHQKRHNARLERGCCVMWSRGWRWRCCTTDTESFMA